MMSKHLAKLLSGAVAVALVAVAMVAPAAQATTPAPGYAAFAGCPSPSENPSIAICLRSVVTGGHFKMGNKEVPISNPITISGGTGEALEGFAANSKGGLVPVKQKVPGGVIGLTGLTWLAEFLGSEALTLYAVTEAAGLPKVGFTDLALSIKVHLINPVLGNNCYVGSNSSPIKLNLTYGTTSPPPPNKPISGVEPLLTVEPVRQIAEVKGGTYVDNSFAAPGANGCTLTLFGFIPVSINGLVNVASGLPSAAGTNETVQKINTELVESKLVYP
jgi:hypothetical protein